MPNIVIVFYACPDWIFHSEGGYFVSIEKELKEGTCYYKEPLVIPECKLCGKTMKQTVGLGGRFIGEDY